jgi:DNA polymerase-1
VASDLLAIDTETTGVDWHDNAFMVSASYYGTDNEYHNWVWDFRDPDMDHDHAYEEIEFYITTADKIIMHNAKFDIQKLCRMGYPLDWFKDKFEDTQAIAHLIDEQQSTSLKYLARTVLGEETDEDEVLKVWRRKNKIKKEEGYEPIPHEILAPYAAKDAEFTLRLYEVLRNQMPEDLQPLYQIEKDLTLALLGIEAKGMQIDKTYVKKQRQEYGDRIYKLKRSIGNMAGEEFNPQSPKQILEVFTQRGLRITATDKATLSALDDELAVAIVELREANKIKSTYFDGLHDEASDGILHPNFRQHGTRTGRMSSGTAEA